MTDVDAPAPATAQPPPPDALPRGSTTRRAAKNALLLVLGDSATKVALFILYAVIARVLGTRGFGDYTVAISLSFFVTSAALGIDVIVSREVARDRANVHGLFWHSIVLKVLAGVPLLAIVTAVAALAHDKTAIVISVALLGLSNLIDVIAQTPHSILRGVEDMAPTSVALVIEGVLEVALAAVALTVFSASLVALGVVAVIASLVAIVYIWVMLYRRGFRPRRTGMSKGRNWLLIAAIPTGITSIFGYLLGRLDAVMLSLMTHNPRTVGLYGGAYRLFEGTLFLSWAIALAVYPVLSRLPKYSRELRRAFERSAMVAAGVSMPLGGLMVFFGPTVVSDVFGNSYLASGTATRLLGICTAIYGVYVLAAFTLAAQDRQKTYPLLAGGALAINVVLNLFLIPSLGLNGAAIAMDVAQGLLTIWMLLLLMGVVGRYSIVRIFASSGVGLVAMGAVALGLGESTAPAALSLLCFALAFLAAETLFYRDDLMPLLAIVRHRSSAADALAVTGPVAPLINMRAPASGQAVRARWGRGPRSRRGRHTGRAILHRRGRRAPSTPMEARSRYILLGPVGVVITGLFAGLLAIAGAQSSPLLPAILLGAAAVATLAYRNPVATVYLALALIPFETLSVISGSSSVLSPTKLVALAAAFGWIARRITRRGEPRQSMTTPLTFPLLLLLVANVPGLFLAIDKGAVAKEILIWGAWDVLFLAIVSDARAVTTERLMFVLCLSGGIVAAFATIRTAGQTQQAFEAAGQITGRASGGFSSPVALGLFVTLILPLQVVLAFRGRTAWFRLVGILGVVFGGSALALALTRGAFLSVGVALAWLVCAYRPLRRPALALFLILLAFILSGFNPAPKIVNVPLLLQRITSINSQTNSAQLRLTLWKASPRIIEDSLPFGIGAKNFPNQSPRYGLIFAGDAAASNAHDTLLAIATEFGVPGVIALLWLLFGIGGGLRRVLSNAAEPEHTLALAMVAVFLALLVDGITDYAPADDAVWLTVMMTFALIGRLFIQTRPDHVEKQRMGTILV